MTTSLPNHYHSPYIIILYTIQHEITSVIGTNSMKQSPWEAVTQLLKKFPAFYGTQRLITMFMRTHHWTVSFLSWMNPVDILTSCMFKIHFNIILICTHRSPQMFSSFQVFKLKFCVHFSYVCAMCPDHPIFLDFITLIVSEEYKLWSSLLYTFVQPPVTLF